MPEAPHHEAPRASPFSSRKVLLAEVRAERFTQSVNGTELLRVQPAEGFGAIGLATGPIPERFFTDRVASCVPGPVPARDHIAFHIGAVAE